VILETERLLFRKPVLADMDAFCAMEADPDVRRYVGGRPRTREEAEKRFLNSLDAPVVGGLYMLSAIYKPEDKYVGRCGIYPHFDNDGNPIPHEASLGLYITKAHWGRGLATEAGRAFIDLGFMELGIERIYAAIQVGNAASVRVMEKLGFSLQQVEQGEHRSYYHYLLNKSDLTQ